MRVPPADVAGAGAASGQAIHDLVARLYPICRSITGDGVRRTLALVGELVPLTVHEVPTGTRAYDWTVPQEWNVRDAYVRIPGGERVIDFGRSNLHVVGYSEPVSARMRLEALRPHLHTLPGHPEWVPYRTSYYSRDWGFCLSQRQLDQLADHEYEVCIDATLADGSLTYGECLLPGRREDEVLISAHVCHPSLANDNCSGVAVAAFLASALASADRGWSYRFLFAPGTIGSITWLSRNEDRVRLVRHGLVLSNLGDAGGVTYKRSRRGDAPIDRAAAHVLRGRSSSSVVDFSPFGYDERQFCSPGFDLAVGALSRTPYGRYPQYHTSADDLSFVSPAQLADSLATCLDIVDVLERDRTFLNLNPRCEPQLGRRGLYRSLGGASEGRERELALLWVLNLSDGRHTLLDVAERAGLGFAAVAEAASALVTHGLLAERQ